MRIYLDTGVFIDYLIYRSQAGSYLRNKGRRSRSVTDLFNDATECLNKIKRNHEGFTSCLTLVEAEETLYTTELRRSKGIPDRRRYIVISSRSFSDQILTMIDLFGFQIVDLSSQIVNRKANDSAIHQRQILARDALHLVTAIIHNADIIISTDQDLLRLNTTLSNDNGLPIRCLDTNDANRIL